MVPKQIVFAVMTFLHDLFTVVWVGGLITLGITVMPSAKKVLGKGKQTKALMDTIQKRLSLLVYVSIVGLAATGLLMANRSAQFQGLFSFANTYSTVLSIKHILMLAMVVIALTRSLVLSRRSGPPQPGEDPAQAQRREKFKAVLLVVNLVLGVLVLLLSGFCTALSAGPPPA